MNAHIAVHFIQVVTQQGVLGLYQGVQVRRCPSHTDSQSARRALSPETSSDYYSPPRLIRLLTRISSFNRRPAGAPLFFFPSAHQSTLIGQLALRGSLFLAYNEAKSFVGASHDNPTSFFLAGGAAWGVASLVETPMDLYKSQMQKELVRWKKHKVAGTLSEYVPVYDSVASAVRASIKHNGAFGPFQGLGATVLRNVPSAALFFGSNEIFKAELCRRAGRAPGDNTLAEMIAAGGAAGICLWVRHDRASI